MRCKVAHTSYIICGILDIFKWENLTQKGELSGLTWSDIDMNNRIISVNHSIHYRDKGTGKHEFFITSPKTVNAIRTIPMSDEVYELL